MEFKDQGLSISINTLEPNNDSYTVSFVSVVGVRILDERDLPEFWHNNVQIEGDDGPSLVYEVLSGGWSAQQKESSPILEAGFYPSIKEWLLLGEDTCVSVLAECAPISSIVKA